MVEVEMFAHHVIKSDIAFDSNKPRLTVNLRVVCKEQKCKCSNKEMGLVCVYK